MTNSKTSRFRVQAGALVFEVEGTEEFIQNQMEKNKEYIDMVLEEQARLIKSGKIPTEIQLDRRKSAGRPKGSGKGVKGRRPGRQPVIVRESQLELKVRQLSALKSAIEAMAHGTRLGKDASVFVIAHQLCASVLGGDTFTAGDVINAYKQLGDHPLLPKAESVDVVQMLRNLAAASIGKEWVARNADGTFSLTEKGKAVATSGEVVRRRGRRPSESAKPAVKKAPGRRGRPPKAAAPVMEAASSPEAETEAAPTPKKRGPKPGAKKIAGRRGRPPKNAAAKKTAVKKTAVKKAAVKKTRGRKPGAKKKA